MFVLSTYLHSRIFLSIAVATRLNWIYQRWQDKFYWNILIYIANCIFSHWHWFNKVVKVWSSVYHKYSIKEQKFKAYNSRYSSWTKRWIQNFFGSCLWLALCQLSTLRLDQQMPPPGGFWHIMLKSEDNLDPEPSVASSLTPWPCVLPSAVARPALTSVRSPVVCSASHAAPQHALRWPARCVLRQQQQQLLLPAEDCWG